MRIQVNAAKMVFLTGLYCFGLVDCSQSGSKKSSGGSPAPTPTPEVVVPKTPAPEPTPRTCLTDNAPTPESPSTSTCSTTPAPETTPSSSDATADGGPGYAACDAQGLAWIPSTSSDMKGQCGPKLVSWCCNETEIYARFGQSAADQLKLKFKTNTDQGLLLYHCGVDGNKYTFYFFKGDGQSIKTGQVWMTQTNVKQDPSGQPCKKLTAQELGADRL